MFDPDIWGTVADWTSGVATVSTLLLGVLTVLHQNRQFLEGVTAREVERDQEARRKLAEQAHERRSDAARLYAWFRVEREFGGVRLAHVWLEASNQTEAPCYEWTVTTAGSMTSLTHESFGPLLPGLHRWDVMDMLPADQRVSLLNDGVPPTTLEFLAVNGERLKRRPSGEVEVTS